MNLIKILFYLLNIVFISLSSYAQPGANDPTFNPTDKGFGFGDGAQYGVLTTAIQNDGKIIVGGRFNLYNGTLVNKIARLDTNGNLDPSFNPGPINISISAHFKSIAVQNDGKIIVGGHFQNYLGTSRRGLVRLNIDGSLDTTFIVSSETSLGVIYSVVIQSDGKILVGGSYSVAPGEQKNIVRLNEDGSIDSSFNCSLETNDYVEAVALQSDGKVLIGGDFVFNDGIHINRLARLNSDGSRDTTFNPGSGANDCVKAITIQSNGKIIVGGKFTSFDGVSQSCIARLNANGSFDTTFNPGTGAFSNFVIPFISTFAIQNDGNIIVGGDFTSFSGTTIYSVIRLNSDGSLDTAFNVCGDDCDGTNANFSILTIAIQSNGKIIIGGGFGFYDLRKSGIARLNEDGSTDMSFNTVEGADNDVHTAAIKSDGKIIISGRFSSYGKIERRGISRLNANGSIDTTFNPGTGANSIINTMAIQSNEKIIIGGHFRGFNGSNVDWLARLNEDGSLDTLFNQGTGINDPIFNISLQTDDKIIISGSFSNYNGTAISKIARLNNNGSIDSTFYPGISISNYIVTSAIQNNGKILVGGHFTNYNGLIMSGLVRLHSNGDLDTSFVSGIEPTSHINTICLQNDGKIIIGGSFTNYNGTAVTRIARLYQDGSLDTSFNVGMGANDNVLSTSMQSDGKIIVGGEFTTFDGIYSNKIARLNTDGSLDTLFNTGSGANADVRTIVIQDDKKIIIGGDFTSYNGNGRSRIARIEVCEDYFSESESMTICNGEIYTWRGSDYITEGVYYDNDTTVNGCDSIYQLILSIENENHFIEYSNICGVGTFYWHGNNYTTAGIYFDSLISINGCDSIIELHLTINSIDTDITLVGNTFTVNSFADAYQWIDCNNNFTEIPGETNQSFTPTINGDYAVIITENGCTDTSVCYTISGIGISEYNNDLGIKIYPNPVRDELIIEGLFEGDVVSLHDVLGININNIQASGKIVKISLKGVPKGIYFLKIGRGSSERVLKVLKL